MEQGCEGQPASSTHSMNRHLGVGLGCVFQSSAAFILDTDALSKAKSTGYFSGLTWHISESQVFGYNRKLLQQINSNGKSKS